MPNAILWFRRTRAWVRDQKLLRKKRRRLAEADSIILSMAKSGRTWLNVMLSHYYHRTHGIPSDELLNADNLKRRGFPVPSVAFTHGREIEGRIALQATMRRKPVVFLYRDPRDVAVSIYFQRIPRKQAIGRDTLVLGQEMPEKLTADILFDPLWLPFILDFMDRWRVRLSKYEQVLPIRYEDMRRDPAAALTAVLGFIDTRRISEEAVQAAVEFASFENLRRLEQAGHFTGGRLGGGRAGDEGSWKVRRGKMGGFADYFPPADVARINAYVAEHLHPSFGYTEHA